MQMEQNQWKQLKQKHALPSHKGRRCVIAFIGGGVIGMLGQGLYELFLNVFHMNMTDANVWMIVTVIVITALLTGCHVYDKLAQVLGAGAFIPISGFANAMVSSALEGKSEGPVYGIGTGMFKLAGAVLTYGISAALIAAMIRYWVGL